MTRNELKRDYINGETVSTASLIKAGILAETEATKMLTAQMNDKNNTKSEQIATRRRIERAGYVLAAAYSTTTRVFEEVL